MRVALVYDRLNKLGGAEQVLVAFDQLYPGADWYTSFWDPHGAPFSLNWKVRSFPYLHKHHEWFPWLMPFIFEAYDFSSYDLVISIGSAESKGVIVRPGTIHLNYCLTPTRYLYSHSEEYLSNPIYRFVAGFLRKWDLIAATRPDEMIAISTQVKKRIKDVYKRDSTIIFPPVDVTKFAPPAKPDYQKTGLPSNYFLVVSRLVPYKKIDILIAAANLSRQHLVIIGQGSEAKKLKKLAGPTVTFLDYVDSATLPSYYRNCRAYLQANEEDFGISMCEAQASGKPVIAYGLGGACDIVTPAKTGVLLTKNTPESFAKAMQEFDTMAFESAACVKNAQRFSQNIWLNKMQQEIKRICHKI